MEIKWHPDVIRIFDVVKGLDGDFYHRDNVPGYIPALLNSLYSAVQIPLVSIGDLDMIPAHAKYQPRTLDTVESLAKWAWGIICCNRVRVDLANIGEHRMARLRDLTPSQWSYSDCNLAGEVLRDELTEQPGVIEHGRFPGCPDKEICAFQENLAASLGFFFLNETLYALDESDYQKALGLFASASEFERIAISILHQRVGYCVESSLQRMELRRRGSKGGSSKSTSNGLKAWVDGQPNATKRTDRQFARELAKRAPGELTQHLADPERVIYEHLRRSQSRM